MVYTVGSINQQLRYIKTHTTNKIKLSIISDFIADASSATSFDPYELKEKCGLSLFKQSYLYENSAKENRQGAIRPRLVI